MKQWHLVGTSARILVWFASRERVLANADKENSLLDNCLKGFTQVQNIRAMPALQVALRMQHKCILKESTAVIHLPGISQVVSK